ncbi:MAG: MFS transporter [Candidatus Thorarchaeota archaeon]|nr:MAG: MFS transporter [Candidatus Thorarchaeota archaeon]
MSLDLRTRLTGTSILNNHEEQKLDKEIERYRLLELVSYFLFAVGPLVGNAVLVLLGAISTDFLVDPTAVLSAIPAFMFPFAVFQLFSGAISDIYGRVPVIVGGLFVFAGGLYMTAYATTLSIFILGNVILGIGFGFVNPVLLALLTDYASPKDIPKRMGIAAALASLSVGLGPFIAGQMVILGWQTYYLMFLMIVVAGLIVISIVKRPPKIAEKGAGLRLFTAHLWGELRKPVVLLILATTFLVALSYLGVFVWTPRGLTGVINDGTIGILLLGGGISGAIAGSLLSTLSRRYGFGLPVGIGFIALFLGLSVFIIIGNLTAASSIPLVGHALISVGWAGGLLFPTMITFSQIISPEHRGVLAGAVTFAFFLGSALIPIMFEPLFHSGISVVYTGMLAVSAILVVFFIVLYRKLALVHQKT